MNLLEFAPSTINKTIKPSAGLRGDSEASGGGKTHPPQHLLAAGKTEAVSTASRKFEPEPTQTTAANLTSWRSPQPSQPLHLVAIFQTYRNSLTTPPVQDSRSEWAEAAHLHTRLVPDLQAWELSGKSLSRMMFSFLPAKGSTTPGVTSQDWLCGLWQGLPLPMEGLEAKRQELDAETFLAPPGLLQQPHWLISCSIKSRLERKPICGFIWGGAIFNLCKHFQFTISCLLGTLVVIHHSFTAGSNYCKWVELEGLRVCCTMGKPSGSVQQNCPILPRPAFEMKNQTEPQAWKCPLWEFTAK